MVALSIGTGQRIFSICEAYRFVGFKCEFEKVCFILTARPFLPASERRGFLTGLKLSPLEKEGSAKNWETAVGQKGEKKARALDTEPGF